MDLVLEILKGGGGVVSSFAFHSELLRLVPRLHLVELVVDLVLESRDTGVDGQRVLRGVLLSLESLLNLVLLVNLHGNCVLDDVDPSVDYWRVLLALSTLSTLSTTQACCLLASDLSSECITK